LELYRDEVPYSCEVLITEFKEREEDKDFISAEVVVERDSQKAIIIGKAGAAIKKLGQEARESIEEFLQREVFLELRVKVRKKWRSDENLLKSFGYSKKE
jgi:GTP-binding protein Era